MRRLELIPASRLTRKWVVTRAFPHRKRWCAYRACCRDLCPEQLAVRAKEVGAGIARLGGGGLKYLVGKVTHNMAYGRKGPVRSFEGLGA